MSNHHLGTTAALALLDQLKATVHEFAAREEKLNAEFRARSVAETKIFDAAYAAQTADNAEVIARASADLQSRRQQSGARFQQRKIRINQAHMASRKRALDAIRDEEGKRKYKVQEGTLNAERRRETGLADAAKALEDFNGKLAQSHEALGALERAILAAFRGNTRFNRMLAANRPVAVDASADENQLLERASQAQAGAREGLERFKKLGLARMFGFFPVWLLAMLLLLGGALLVPDVQSRIGNALPWQKAGIGLIAVSAALVAGRIWGTGRARPIAAAIADDFTKARSLQNACYDKAQLHYQQEVERLHSEFESATGHFGQEWKQAIKQAIDRLDQRPKEIDEQAQRVTQKSEQLQRQREARFENDDPAALARLQQEREAASQQLTQAHEAKLAGFDAQLQSKLDVLEGEWKSRIQPIYHAIQQANTDAQSLFPEWQLQQWEKWTPPQEFKNAAKVGRVDVDVSEMVETATKDKRLALPANKFQIPLLLTYPVEGSILLQTSGAGNDEAMAAINNIIFRLLSTTPPGKLSFTIFDPVGLGQNFAGLMHLADYEESHINSRIWTQTNQLEEKLAELNEHMEKVIQMYLRNEYPTIAEYNAQAGTIAEKYHFLVIADFPVNFSDTALRRLINIASSGARCGVYTLIHWDKRQALPHGFVADELGKNSICLTRTSRGFEIAGHQPAGMRIAFDAPPSPEFATHFLHEVGESGKGSNRVEVPFDQVAPAENKIWTERTAEELRVPIGRSGATKLQYLEIGKGTRQHALIAGKTGSGKSTLFHVIITNLALWCSPEEVEFYLVDFKKGVEFKCYATRRLPHGRVVAIESDRDFGLSVLQRVDDELRRRGDLFRELGVQDLAGYKRAGGKEPMPRSLLMIDEFQEFFTEEDRVSQGAAVLLDRIVRQGRAFGIHVLLGSQTLGGAYTLARATIGQMVIRIALQCNEADAYLIMDQDNPAPRLLSRPGEGIYNDSAGAIEGNSPFQAVWLAEDVRDGYLAKVRERASRTKFPGPFVFEGNAAADIRENAPLNERLRLAAIKAPAQVRVWLGAPNSIKGPTEAVFQKQSGSNLLIVGQSDERALTLLGIALVSLATQYPKPAARFILLDSTPAGFSQREFLDRAIQAVPQEVVQVKAGELAEAMGKLAKELKRRGEEQDADAPDTFVLIHGLQNYKKLRQEDEFGYSSNDPDAARPPAAVLLDLISEGPARGIHVIITCDTYNNVNRFLGRKTISEFEMRLLFQMSAADSASLIDDPAASTLGLNRAIYYNDREGQMETFRPYALPNSEWTDNAAQQLKP